MSVYEHDLSNAAVKKAYGHWAAIYDALCGPIFSPAHRAAASAASQIGGDILEVGVGTGLVLPLYRNAASVTGLDLSEEMLMKARARLGNISFPHRVSLEMGDIHTLAHPDEGYDVIVLPFVLTLLSEPEVALDNCRRMLRPGGEIIIVSHFQSQTRWIADLERWIAPRLARLGLRPDFPVSRIEAWAAPHADLNMHATEYAGPFGIYQRVRIAKW